MPLTLFPNGKILSVLYTQDEMGTVAIFNAIAKRRAHMVHSLIKAGANINGKNVEGRAPPMLAAELDCIDIVELLIKKHADWLLGKIGFKPTQLYSVQEQYLFFYFSCHFIIHGWIFLILKINV